MKYVKSRKLFEEESSIDPDDLYYVISGKRIDLPSSYTIPDRFNKDIVDKYQGIILDLFEPLSDICSIQVTTSGNYWNMKLKIKLGLLELDSDLAIFNSIGAVNKLTCEIMVPEPKRIIPKTGICGILPEMDPNGLIYERLYKAQPTWDKTKVRLISTGTSTAEIIHKRLKPRKGLASGEMIHDAQMSWVIRLSGDIANFARSKTTKEVYTKLATETHKLRSVSINKYDKTLNWYAIPISTAGLNLVVHQITHEDILDIFALGYDEGYGKSHGYSYVEYAEATLAKSIATALRPKIEQILLDSLEEYYYETFKYVDDMYQIEDYQSTNLSRQDNFGFIPNLDKSKPL